jgi:hypothetical protein
MSFNDYAPSIPESDSSILPWHITLSALGGCLSLIVLATETAATDNSPEPTDIERLAYELDLSKDQVLAVDQILEQALTDRRNIKDSADERDREDHRAALKAITENADGQLKSVLTEDQFSNYISLRTQLRREALRHRVRESRWHN